MPWFGIFGFWNSAAQLFLLGVVSVVVGYGSYKKVKKESEKIVFLCKSCGNAWSEVDRNVNVGSKLPRFKIVKSCPSCNKNLSDEERRLLKLKP
jgi:DNA replicative helicase MCM subunit Mcm2 (Cdc46/Mcm family)